jgi:hypothetical protein
MTIKRLTIPPPDVTRFPAAWRQFGLVILCGAGLSIAPPSSVPSWWEFNEGVLRGIRHRYQGSLSVPARARAPLARLSLEKLDLNQFSQTIADAFAGATWFELLSVLDSGDPNENHRALVALATTGILRSILTTNFDTLIERTFSVSNRQFSAVNTLTDPPPRDWSREAPVVVKLHGTANNASSLVDLASQKRRGLPTEWLDSLERLFATSSILIVGFSGADLGLFNDYLRLEAASKRIPWLRWLCRPRQIPRPEAARLVDTCGERADFIEGELPDAFRLFGLDTETTPSMTSAEGHLARLDKAVEQWLDSLFTDGAPCGVALSRFLDHAGSHSAAAAVRSALRMRVRRQLREGVSAANAPWVAQVLGQVAAETIEANPSRALADLDLALRALDRVVKLILAGGTPLEPATTSEYEGTRASLLQNKAHCSVLLRDADAAEGYLDEASKHVDHLRGYLKLIRRSAEMELRGAIAFLRRDPQSARMAWLEALTLARRAGHVKREAAVVENLRTLDPVDPPEGETWASRSRDQKELF